VSKALDTRELQKQMLKLSKDAISDKEIQDILRSSAEPLVLALRLKAPMEMIRQDIGIVANPSKYPRAIMVGLSYDKGPATNLGYAFEYGTVERYTKHKDKASGYRGRLEPKPWFRPTLDTLGPKIVTDITNKLAKLVENKLKK
jgi:hypothetical protein